MEDDLFYTEEEVRTKFGISSSTLDYLRHSRRILACPSWDGSARYFIPQFIHSDDGVELTVRDSEFIFLRSDVIHVLQSTSRRFDEWRAVLWFYRNGLRWKNVDGSVQRTPKCDMRDRWVPLLRDIGLWTADWVADVDDIYTGRDLPDKKPLSDLLKRYSGDSDDIDAVTLFRVTREWFSDPHWVCRAHTPEYMRTLNVDKVFSTRDGANQRILFADGRFDPHFSPGADDLTRHRGSIYYSPNAKGCWTEIFDREPTVFLDDVLSRKLWSFKLSATDVSSKQFVDLRSLSVAVSATSLRPATQAVATRIAREKDECNGIFYTLRSNSEAEGIAYFARFRDETNEYGGVPHPDDVAWLSNRSSKEAWEELSPWQTLVEMQRMRHVPVVTFRRFPMWGERLHRTRHLVVPLCDVILSTHSPLSDSSVEQQLKGFIDAILDSMSSDVVVHFVDDRPGSDYDSELSKFLMKFKNQLETDKDKLLEEAAGLRRKLARSSNGDGTSVDTKGLREKDGDRLRQLSQEAERLDHKVGRIGSCLDAQNFASMEQFQRAIRDIIHSSRDVTAFHQFMLISYRHSWNYRIAKRSGINVIDIAHALSLQNYGDVASFLMKELD